jgi:hypothetical protein
MQNRVDEAQMRVPGYRDRVVHVSLSSREGGMNLNMPATVVKRLTKRGLFAGRRLVERFALPPPSPKALSWDSHRWTRFRSIVAVFSDLSTAFSAAYLDPAEVISERSYRELSERGAEEPPSAYRWARAVQAELGIEFVAELSRRERCRGIPPARIAARRRSPA